MGEYGDLRAVETLIQTLEDPFYEERKAAKKDLLKFGEPGIVSLIRDFEGLYNRERAGAVYVLGAIRESTSCGNAYSSIAG